MVSKSLSYKVVEFFRNLVSGLNTAGCFVTAIMMILVVLDVCSRYFFNYPIQGVTEIIALAIVIVAFFQIPFVQMNDRHLKSTAFYKKMPLNMKRGVKIIDLILGSVIFILVCKSSWIYFLRSVSFNEFEGGAVKITTIPSRLSIVIGSAVMVIIQISQLFYVLFVNDVKLENIETSETEGCL